MAALAHSLYLRRCTPEAFAAGVVAEWGLTVTAEAFLDAFRHWPKRLFPGVRDMLALLAQRCTLACLSNTNMHWPHARHLRAQRPLAPLLSVARDRPPLAALALRSSMSSPTSAVPLPVVFLDDNQLNVDAAQAVGIQAYRTVGIAEVQTALCSLGLLKLPSVAPSASQRSYQSRISLPVMNTTPANWRM